MSDQGSNGPSFGDIKIELLSNLPRLVRELAPGGRMANGYYMSKNPTRNDRKAGSFWVRTNHPAKGSWRDEATGDKGDIINFVTYCAGLSGPKETYSWCMDWLGWSNKPIDRNALAEKRQVAAQQERQADIAAERDLERNRKSAKAMWLGASKDFAASAVAEYLRTRQVDLDLFDKVPGVLRHYTDHQHKGKDGKRSSWPVMIAAMSDAKGQIGAVHRTWIMRDGSSKAEIDPSRKIWPTYKGYVIRIAKGTGNLSPEEATRQNRRGTLVVTEGVEDALSVAISCPHLRVWAAGTLGNIGLVPVLPCISKIIICADNDWNNPQAEQQLAKSTAALKRQRIPVHVVHSWHGKDPNDLLRG